MKQVNIDELPLYNPNNINTAIEVAQVLYPDGVRINFPAGVYRTGQNPTFNLLGNVKLVGESTEYDKYDIFFLSPSNTRYPGLEKYRNLRNRRNGPIPSDPQYSAMRECYLDNLFIPPINSVPFRPNSRINAIIPFKKPQVPQLSWVEFLKSF